MHRQRYFISLDFVEKQGINSENKSVFVENQWSFAENMGTLKKNARGNEKKTRLGLVNSEKCASFAIANEEQRMLLTNITP